MITRPHSSSTSWWQGSRRRRQRVLSGAFFRYHARCLRQHHHQLPRHAHFTGADSSAVFTGRTYTFVAGDDGVHTFDATLKTASAGHYRDRYGDIVDHRAQAGIVVGPSRAQCWWSWITPIPATAGVAAHTVRPSIPSPTSPLVLLGTFLHQQRCQPSCRPITPSSPATVAYTPSVPR